MNELQMIHECFDLIYNHFEKDPEKTIRWFETENPIFGYTSAHDLIKAGRVKKVLQYVKAELEIYD